MSNFFIKSWMIEKDTGGTFIASLDSCDNKYCANLILVFDPSVFVGFVDNEIDIWIITMVFVSVGEHSEDGRSRYVCSRRGRCLAYDIASNASRILPPLQHMCPALVSNARLFVITSG